MTRICHPPLAALPAVHLMAGGDWQTMVTAAGSGYMRWREMAVSRWRADAVRDGFGAFLFVRDCRSGTVHAATLQPLATRSTPSAYAAEFSDNQARFTRCDGDLHAMLTIAPLAAGDGEVRMLTLRNSGSTARTLDVISYVPLVLGPAAADAAHPAFAKMFVQTKALDGGATLLAWRRKSSRDEPGIVAAHFCTADGTGIESVGFETDRLRFIGRGRELANAVALATDAPAPGHDGTVLDPIFALRRRATLEPGATAHLRFWTLAAAERNALLGRVAACRKADAPKFAQEAPAANTDILQTLTSALLYNAPALRATPQTIARAAGGPPVLWAHGVSGDRPIVLARIHNPEQAGLARELDAAQAWWQRHGIAVDLVLICDSDGNTHDTLRKLKDAAELAQRTGQTFVFTHDELTAAQHDGLAAAARIVLDATVGNLADHARPLIAAAAVSTSTGAPCASAKASPAEQRTRDPGNGLEYFNGFGGFATGGAEYRVHVRASQPTPMPWINVIANERFGFTVSERGAGYAWAVNSQKNTLTPWSNDPVRDPPGDVLYLGDVERHVFWSATPAPVDTGAACEVRHAPGSTRFRQTVGDIATDLVQFVPMHDTLKISLLKVRNRAQAPRTLRVVAYVDWKLGGNGDDCAPFIVTACDAETGALTARNDWRADYAGRVAFADLRGAQQEWTCDRREFLGRHGGLAAPLALRTAAALRGRSDAGTPACAALATTITLQPGEERELAFLLGEAANIDTARQLIRRYRETSLSHVLGAVRRHWHAIGGALQVETPERQLDLLVNHWLPYQIVSCRLHARTAFYQASGAWGFRDQLQDVSALTLNAPQIARAHLLRAAARQFAEGDVQHWWLPPSGAGVRTRMVDDRLWLPYVAAHYVAVTGDRAVLDATIPFLEGKPLAADQVDDFYAPLSTAERASLYEHCARAIEASLATGAHGLPLFGTGDWNDGMNRVGREGRGESVWMGWFLIAVIRALAPIAEERGETTRAGRWRAHAAALEKALESQAWDGGWWRRGWYDDGTPLGSHENRECRIDGIAQSWAVMAQAANPERARTAMAAVDRMLVRRDAQVVALLTPPFDLEDKDPGYIRGYPPGLRENGGQYTHGSAWAVVAFAMLGDGDRAWELFNMLQPIAHAQTPEAVARWQVEPYVACGDVYTAPQHLGRGGWSWYTGSAGWLYRAATEWILGLRVRGDVLHMDPCIPHAWPGFTMTLRWRSATYVIRVDNPVQVCRGVTEIFEDGANRGTEGAIRLQDDNATHAVRVVLG